MLLSRLLRLSSQLTCLLLARVVTATITPSDTSTAVGQFQGTLPLTRVEVDQARIADLVPLTREAATRSIEGNLFNTNFSNVANISVGDIAYISCNPSDYPGYADPQRVFQSAYSNTNISGVILYSTATDYCDYELTGNQQMMNSFPVLSMTNTSASASLLDAIDNLPVHMKYFVKVQRRSDDGNNNGGAQQQQQQNPLGPSPSTAVAMIILYSITGIITALFLIIIITGAIRAHRHPERYGPRDVLGRPRQTRARGLGRAILDTIPIVKFGEKEPAKPTDVELASAVEARDLNGIDGAGDETNQVATGTSEAPKIAAATNAAPQVATSAPVEEHQEGIAPAQAITPAAASGTDKLPQDESLGCSICTEDFEKGQDLRVLPCDHKFHSECVDPWLLNVSGTCPLCRVDLRPVTSRDSSNDDDLALAVNLEAETSHRRRTTFRDLLSLRQRPMATPEERIYALRRHREQQRRSGGEVVAESGANASSEDVRTPRMSKRMSARLSGVFTGRTRREHSPTRQGESSGSGAQQPPRDESLAPDVGTTTDERPA